MIDIQNTIDTLEQNVRWIEDIECHQFPGWANVTSAIKEAIGVIEVQNRAIESLQSDLQDTLAVMDEHVAQIKRIAEPVKPRYEDKDMLHPYCGNCGRIIWLVHGTLHHPNYCGECGRKVDWSR